MEVERFEGVARGVTVATAVEMYGKVQRPRFKRRTWGTLRVVLICEWVKVSTFGRREFADSGAAHLGRPPIQDVCRF
jgi:hypothetical protein